MSREFVNGLRDLLAQMDSEAEAAYDLWSWLPSRKVAERHHGDYASNVQPTVADIMREAALVLAEAAGSKLDPAERADFFEKCPCGEDHETAVRERASRG